MSIFFKTNLVVVSLIRISFSGSLAKGNGTKVEEDVAKVDSVGTISDSVGTISVSAGTISGTSDISLGVGTVVSSSNLGILSLESVVGTISDTISGTILVVTSDSSKRLGTVVSAGTISVSSKSLFSKSVSGPGTIVVSGMSIKIS